MDFKQKKQREQITKCFRLGLDPVEATLRTLGDLKLNEADETLRENAEKIKPIVDELIKDVETKGLDVASCDYNDAYKYYVEKDYKKFDKECQKIEKQIKKCMDAGLPDGIRKTADLKSQALLSKALPEFIAKQNISNTEKHEKEEIVNSLFGCLPMITTFATSRITVLDTWAPQRVTENMAIYFENMQKAKTFIESEFSEEFLKENAEFESFKDVSFYDMCLTPNAIDGYNRIINGTYDADGNLVTMGYNQFINELNDKLKNDKGYTGAYFKKLKPLYQQIFYQKPKQFTINKIDTEEQLKALLKETTEYASKETIFEVVSHIKNGDKEGILVLGRNLASLSHLVYNDVSIIPKAAQAMEVKSIMETVKNNKINKKAQKALDNVNNLVNKKFYSMKELETLCDNDNIFDLYCAALVEQFAATNVSRADFLSSGILDEETKVFGQTRYTKKISKYMKTFSDLRRIVNIIKARDVLDQENCDVTYYNKLDDLYEVFYVTDKALNQARNYLTRSPKDIAETVPVCFGAPGKFDTKVLNQDTLDQSMFTIMEMDGKYYYITLTPGAKKIDLRPPKKDAVRLFNQKKSGAAYQAFPKFIFKYNGFQKVEDYFKENPDKEEMILKEGVREPVVIKKSVYENYKKGWIRKSAVTEGEITEGVFKNALKEFIELCIDYANKRIDWERFNFEFKDAKEYTDLNDFFAYCDTAMYDQKWVEVDREQMENAIEEGQVLCFLIYNRNMYKDDNEKTSYAKLFLAIMSDKNIENGYIKLNARPDIAFRKACMEYRCTHPKGSMLLDRKTKDGEYIREDLYLKLYRYGRGYIEKSALYDDAEAMALLDSDRLNYHEANYDIVKNKRYMEDRWFITFSYIKNARIPANFINSINEEIAEDVEKMNTLTVIRNATDLVYYILRDKEGNVVEKRSLNKIGDTDFHAKLKSLSEQRNLEKAETWEYNLKVSNIKNSYINFACSEIAKVAVEHNAIIIMEKVSDNFKDKMSVIDNQVYKSFENKLSEKLRDFYTKDGQDILNPIQLTKDVGTLTPKQNGILMRENTAYTSSTDSRNGFANLFSFGSLRTVKDKQEFLKNFEEIRVDGNFISYKFDYKAFDCGDNLQKTNWTIFAGKLTVKWNNQYKRYDYINNPADEVIALLNNVAESNLAKAELSGKQAEALVKLLMNTVKLRNVKKYEGKVAKEYFDDITTKEIDTSLSQSENMATNLYNKFIYNLKHYEELEAKLKDDKSKAYNWLNHYYA